MNHLGPSLRRRKRVARPWQRVLLAVLVSLAANLLALWEIRIDWARRPGPEPVRPVALAPLSPLQWEENRSVGKAPSGSSMTPPPVAIAPKPPPQTPQAPGQVVDVAPSKDNTAPKSSRFVSDRNNTVEKETRSRHARAGYENTVPRPSEPTVKPSPLAETPGRQGGEGGAKVAGDGRKPGGVAGAAKIPEQAPRLRLALQFAPGGELRPREERRAVRGSDGEAALPGQGGEGGLGPRGGKPGPIDPGRLQPSASFYERLAGGPAPDHLEGVDESEGTFLNTREWKYATYFNRIKQAVASAWDPSGAMRQRDPTGHLFGYKDRITVLAVTLNDQGALTDLAVQKTCGVDFIDRTALEAFRKAQPFVNPPRGLADAHGEIKFSFGFYLEFGSPGLRIFRGPSPPE